MNLGNHLGLSQHEHIAGIFQIDVVRAKTIASIIGLGRLITLDHRSHGPIQDQDTFCKKLLEITVRANWHGKVVDQGLWAECSAAADGKDRRQVSV